MYACISGKQYSLIAPHLGECATLLDFGSGDLSLAKTIHRHRPHIKLTGIDVADSGERAAGVRFLTYDGKRLPFRQDQFDATVAYHVFHHCADPRQLLVEVMRVTKNMILMVEPVWRTSVDLFFMKILDRIGNGWRNVAIPMPFTFQKETVWTGWVQKNGWRVKEIRSAGMLPSWLPIGETKLFVLVRRP